MYHTDGNVNFYYCWGRHSRNDISGGKEAHPDPFAAVRANWMKLAVLYHIRERANRGNYFTTQTGFRGLGYIASKYYVEGKRVINMLD